MHLEYETSETERKIVRILARSSKPTPIQEIAGEIQESYDDTKQHIMMLGKRLTIHFFDLPDEKQAVAIVTSQERAGF